MDTRNLILYCRKGDFERVKWLVERGDVDVNVRDEWDSTPLYYACLCGHKQLVSFLLEAGARCQANTFDGERCIYGALTLEIRNLLKESKVVSKQTIRRDLYLEFLRRLLESGDHSDITFVVHGKQFLAHKSILGARSEYFLSSLLNKWKNKSVIHVSHSLVDPAAFKSVLQFIYTGQLETDLDSIAGVSRLARQLRLATLIHRLDSVASRAHFFQSTKPGVRVTSLLVESPPQDNELRLNLSSLAEESLPPIFASWVGAPVLPFPLQKAPFADIIFQVQGHQFACHKCFFSVRSDYFKVLITSPINCADKHSMQSTPSSHDQFLDHVPVIPFNQFTPRVFMYILYHIYQDTVKLDCGSVLDVLVAADICLLHGLKRQCGVFMSNNLDCTNVVQSLLIARMYDLKRLEDNSYQFMAEHLQEMVEDVHFQTVVFDDARAVQGREVTDTIDVIDNIRYHLTAASIDEAHDKLQLIDDMLQILNLEA